MLHAGSVGVCVGVAAPLHGEATIRVTRRVRFADEPDEARAVWGWGVGYWLLLAMRRRRRFT